MKLDEFIQKETNELIENLSEYLKQEITHNEIQVHIDRIIQEWGKLDIEAGTPYLEGEKEFWCATWSTQHLASEDHWKDCVTQIDLGVLLRVLKGESPLPPSYKGKRP